MTKITALLCALFVLSCPHVWAQNAGRSVGHVERMAIRKGEPVDSTKDARFLRVGGTQLAKVQDPLYRRDLLRLYKPLFVDLRFREASLSSRAVLGPGLQPQPTLETKGIYEILDNEVTPLSRFQLVVRRGAMVVEHLSGQLDAVASDTRTRIFGTTVLFDVNEDNTEGTVFLEKGHISFPDYEIDATGENRAWRLRSGQPPVELSLGRQERRRYQKEIKRYTSSVWEKPVPFWKKRSFIIPASAVVVGGAAFLLTRGSSDGYSPPDRYGGEVIISLPN